MTQILNPRETYIFPEYIETPFSGSYEQLAEGNRISMEQSEGH